MTPDQQYPRLGRYEVIHKIAEGGMAEILLAKTHGAMGFERLVALKRIHAHLTRDAEFVKMFIDEARIAMHLHHRNIVQTVDLDKDDDTYFMAMEYIHGVNLYEVYEKLTEHGRWFDPPLSLYIISEVAKGLHFAHTRVAKGGVPLGIVHRDISPQNVLLSFEGEVKITDFGIAKARERLHRTNPGIVKGKYAYMAPEVLKSVPADARVDVFAAGVILHELLVGGNPFAAASTLETVENVLHFDVPPPSTQGANISTDLDDIVLKALAKDRDQRFQTALELSRALTEHGLNLTIARRDIASGDASIRTLLAELFPERLERPRSSLTGRRNSPPDATDALARVSTVATGPSRRTNKSREANTMPATPRPRRNEVADDTIQDPREAEDLAVQLNIPISDAFRPDMLRASSSEDDFRGEDARTVFDAVALAHPSENISADSEDVPPPTIKEPDARSSSFRQRSAQAVERLKTVIPRVGPNRLRIALVIIALIIGAVVATTFFGDAKNVAEISIDSTPPGAWVNLDGKQQADRTPMILKVTTDAEHQIVVWSPGYLPVTRMVGGPHGAVPRKLNEILSPSGQ